MTTYQIRPGDDSAWRGSYETYDEALAAAEALQADRPWTAPQVRDSDGNRLARLS